MRLDQINEAKVWADKYLTVLDAERRVEENANHYACMRHEIGRIVESCVLPADKLAGAMTAMLRDLLAAEKNMLRNTLEIYGVDVRPPAEEPTQSAA